MGIALAFYELLQSCFVLKFVLTLLALALPFWGEELIVSYRGVYMEHRVYNQSFQVTRAMVPHGDRKVVAVFELPLERGDEEKTFTRWIYDNQEQIIDRLFEGGILLTDTGENTAVNTRTKTVIVLPALRLRASIKGNLVSIAVLE